MRIECFPRTVSMLILLSVMIAIPANAQEMPVPVDLQNSLFMKVLTFDRNLKKYDKEEIIIGILYQSKYRNSLNAKNQLLTATNEIADRKINSIPYRYIPIEVGDMSEIETAIINAGVRILYITPMRNVDFSTIGRVCRANQILTITGVPEYVESEFAVGIGIRSERPIILINLAEAKAEGADFTSQILKLAKIIENDAK